MPSSHPEPLLSAAVHDTASATSLAIQAALTYDRALTALASGDLATVGRLLEEVEIAVASLDGACRDGHLDSRGDAIRRVRESHARLMAAVRDAKSAVGVQLDRVRDGKRTLQGYGGRGDATGSRLNKDA